MSASTISDFTADKVEIELHLSRGATAETVMDQLYAHTDCEVSISSNMVVIRGDRPVEVTVSDYLKEFTGILKKQIKAELEHELSNLENRRQDGFRLLFFCFREICRSNRRLPRIPARWAARTRTAGNPG